MKAFLIPERLSAFKEMPILSGKHDSIESGMCAMEAASKKGSA